MRIESRIDSPELEQSAHHKARADEQHEGHVAPRTNSAIAQRRGIW